MTKDYPSSEDFEVGQPIKVLRSPWAQRLAAFAFPADMMRSTIAAAIKAEEQAMRDRVLLPDGYWAEGCRCTIDPAANALHLNGCPVHWEEP